MKRLFSVLMVAAIATFTFAFTTPKAAFNDPFHLEGSTWFEGSGDGCSDDGAACEIETSTSGVDAAAIPAIMAQDPGGVSFFTTTTPVDHDNDGGAVTPLQNVTVVNIQRLP